MMEASVISLPTRARSPELGLSDQECFAVAAALRHRDNLWIPARDEDFDGAVIMALLPYRAPEGADYVIRRTGGGFLIEGDRYSQYFANLDALLETLNLMLKN